MTFPTLFTVGLHTYSGSSGDYNTSAYTPAKNTAGVIHRVYGWSVPSATEPKIAGVDRVVVDLELLAPPGFPAGPHDLVDIPVGPNAGQYEVIGEVEDFNHGPFGFSPGLVVNLRRVTV